MLDPVLPEIDRDPLHVRLLECKRLTIDTTWDAADVRSSYWRLYVNSRDGAGVVLDDGVYPLPGKRVHLIPAWVHFSCRCTRPVEHFYIHFDVIGWPGSLVREVFAAPVTLARDVTLDAIVHAALEHDHAVAARFATKAVVNLALARLIEQLPDHGGARLHQLALGEHEVSPAVRFIDEHLAEPISNAALARLCHISEDHFIRRFAACVGQTPGRYLVERRIATAARLLQFTAMSIDQVAQRSGFANRFHFSRVFARYMGVPPAAYRRSPRV